MRRKQGVMDDEVWYPRSERWTDSILSVMNVSIASLLHGR